MELGFQEKSKFKIFKDNVDLVYLDNAATTHKPDCVLESMYDYYSKFNGNTRRGLYGTSWESEKLYEKARTDVSKFINASSSKEIVFTKNTTESINMIAYGYCSNNLKEGDEILISIMEHHSNIVPWQLACRRAGAILRYVYVDSNGLIDVDSIEKSINERTKLVSIAHVSNVLGCVNPVKKIVDIVHRKNVPILVDGAQAIPHINVNVRDIGCDFYVFSGHKMYAPLGVGCLYAKSNLLEEMNVFCAGGGMIDDVSEQSVSFCEIPNRFEAGTQNIVGAIGLSKAIEYLLEVGINNIYEYEENLTKYLIDELEKVRSIHILCNKKNVHGIVSFVVDKIHPHDLSTILDKQNISIRAGTHCAMPLFKYINIQSSVRISIGLYNTQKDIDRIIECIQHVTR